MKGIILASASPRRRELLEQIGVEFEIRKAEGEEIITSSVPSRVVKALSGQKAREVASRCGEDAEVVIGADTVVAVDGRILGKPKDEAEAATMLQSLQGREHEVVTGVTVLLMKSGKEICFSETTRVRVYPMSHEQIQNYVATGDPMDKAGAYGIQGAFAAYIKGIEGDYNNVVGLPVGRLYQEVLAAGVDLKA